MKILDISLKGDTLRFTAEIRGSKVTSSVKDVGEDLLFGKLVRRIHVNDDFHAGLRWAFRDDINELRILLNEKLNEQTR
jgi:hypothetical protein